MVSAVPHAPLQGEVSAINVMLWEYQYFSLILSTKSWPRFGAGPVWGINFVKKLTQPLDRIIERLVIEYKNGSMRLLFCRDSWDKVFESRS
jgi:hypothetical protein